MKNLFKRTFQSMNVEKFLTLPEEKLILSLRKHWFTITPPATFVIVSGLFLMSISFILFLRFSLFSFPVFISSFLALLVLTLAAISKIIIDWYYHFYIVTTRRILEITNTPLFSYSACDVLLDQVRITEIDAKIDNFFNGLIDMGDIKMTFDRPSHEEQFIFSEIENPKEVESYLYNALGSLMHDTNVWFPKRKSVSFVRVAEDIFPKPVNI